MYLINVLKSFGDEDIEIEVNKTYQKGDMLMSFDLPIKQKFREIAKSKHLYN